MNHNFPYIEKQAAVPSWLLTIGKGAKALHKSKAGLIYKIPIGVAATTAAATAEIPEYLWPFTDSEKYPKLSQYRGVPSMVRLSSQILGSRLADGIDKSLLTPVKTQAIDAAKQVTENFKMDENTVSGFKDKLDQVGDAIKQMTSSAGSGIGKGMSSVFEPTVRMLGVSGIGAGAGGITAYAIARQLTRNRLLRTLATMLGAGVGGLGGYALNTHVLDKYVWGGSKDGSTAKTKKTKDSKKDKEDKEGKDTTASSDNGTSSDKPTNSSDNNLKDVTKQYSSSTSDKSAK